MSASINPRRPGGESSSISFLFVSRRRDLLSFFFPNPFLLQGKFFSISFSFSLASVTVCLDLSLYHFNFQPRNASPLHLLIIYSLSSDLLTSCLDFFVDYCRNSYYLDFDLRFVYLITGSASFVVRSHDLIHEFVFLDRNCFFSIMAVYSCIT